MIREAGGTVEDLDGGPLNLGPGVANVLATNGHLHDELAAIIRAVDGAG
jgi:fructose-1,6-bisphosphatase/inositol monophosphatase family enzyme